MPRASFTREPRRPRARHDQTDPTLPKRTTTTTNNNNNRPSMTATSVRNTFAIAIAIAIASLASVALAQDPCSCKEACQVLSKPTCVNLCYVTGGTSCPIATPSRSKFGWAWVSEVPDRLLSSPSIPR